MSEMAFVDTDTFSALDSGFRDFEDAIQYHTALNGDVATLLTRNGRDYPNPSITVCSAEEFLARRIAT